jgi:hypothetical protein
VVESTSQMEDVAAVIVGNTSAIGGSRNFLSANRATHRLHNVYAMIDFS